MSSTSKLVLASLLAAVVTPAWAAPRTFTIQPDSVITYTGKHPAHEWKGVSRSLRGKFTLDPDSPALETPVTVSVPVRSFDSGNRNRDSNALATLDASRFPQVSLRVERLTNVKHEAAGSGAKGTATVEGTLTFHGVSKPITFPISGQFDGNRLRATANFPVSVTAHGIERPKLLFVPMEDTIHVSVQLNAKAD